MTQLIKEYTVPNGIEPYHFTVAIPTFGITAVGVGSTVGFQPKVFLRIDDQFGGGATETFHVLKSDDEIPTPVDLAHNGGGLRYIGSWIRASKSYHLFQEYGV